MSIYIYGLFDPRTLELRYIGRTKNIALRLKGHISEAKHINKKDTHKNNWIKQLLNEGLEPAIEILEECTIDTWEQAERGWITDCKKHGVRLVNIARGGEKPPSFNELPDLIREQVREQWSKTRKGRPSANKGKGWPQEYKDKMSQSLSGSNNPMFGKFGKDHPATGRIVSEETRQRLSDALKRNGNPMQGKSHSEETKKKFSLSGEMCRAFKAELLEQVFDLQKQYFELCGFYCRKYPHP